MNHTARDYVQARAAAQSAANADGYDRGLAYNKLFHEWSFKMLPQKRNRYGHELQCEVVSCEHLERCKPGHGPCA